MDFIAEHKDFFGIGSMIIIFIVAAWLSNRAKKPKKTTGWKGYFGYQVSGACEVQVVMKKDSDLASYAYDFAVKSLGLEGDEAVRQISISLSDRSGEIYLTNPIGEKYLLKQGPGHTLKRQMLNDDGKPIMIVSPGVRYESPDD